MPGESHFGMKPQKNGEPGDAMIRPEPSFRSVAIALPAAVVGLFLIALSGYSSSPVVGAAGTAAKSTVARPDVHHWITVGTTLRMKAEDLTAPNQLRHVQLQPKAYETLLKTGALPDGAVLAATFHAVEHDPDVPTLYAPAKQVFFALHVLDKDHPDGRRFYNFAGDAETAEPLPVGNACAACHNSQGGLQGTFAQHYPLLAKFATTPPGATSPADGPSVKHDSPGRAD